MKLVTLIIGRNYHTSWQNHPAMRFKLAAVDGDKVKLKTKRSVFWCNHSELRNINKHK